MKVDVSKLILDFIPPIVVFIVAIIIFNFGLPTKNKEIYPEFKSALIQILKDDSSIDKEKSILILDSLLPLSVDRNNSESSLRIFLVKFHYEIVSGKINIPLPIQDPPEHEEENTAHLRNEWGSNIQSLIKKLDEVSPFQNLPTIEASLFQDISSLNKDPELNRKLKQLSNLMQVRFGELEQARAETRLGIIIGIIGLLASIIPFLYSKIKRTSITTLKSDL